MKIFLILLTILMPSWFNKLDINEISFHEITELNDPSNTQSETEEQLREVVDKWIEVFSDPSNSSLVDGLYRQDFTSKNSLFRKFRRVNRGNQVYKKNAYKTALKSYFDDFQVRNVRLVPNSLELDEDALTAKFSVDIRVRAKQNRNSMANSIAFQSSRGLKTLSDGKGYRIRANVSLQCNSPIIFNEDVWIGPIEDDDN